MAIAPTSAPEPGQLVAVRSRRRVVGEVGRSTLPPPPPEPVPAAPQHFVSLLSVEDDALGEELQVVREIEPGAAVIETVALPEPTGFMATERLDALLDVVRRGTASAADARKLPSSLRWAIIAPPWKADCRGESAANQCAQGHPQRGASVSNGSG